MLQPQKNPAPNLMVMKIIWGALLFSQLMYLIVLNNFLRTKEPHDAAMFVIVMPSMAAIYLIVGIFIPRMMWKQAKEKFKGQDLSSLPEETLYPYFFTPFIIRLALFEAIAISGFALSFLSGRNDYYLSFLSVSVFCFLMNFPTKEKIISCLKQ